MIRLATDYEGSAGEAECAGRRSRTCRQRKPNVQAEEDRRAGRGSRTFWSWKTIVLAGEGKRSGSVGASALAEEDKCALAEEDKCACRGRQARLLWKMSVLAVEDECACCGRRACRLWKESGFQKDVRRAGERGNVGWQVCRREPMTMRGLVDLSGGVGRRRNECALLVIAWESEQENAARCICHLSALRCPLQRAAFAIAPRSVLSSISIRRLSRRFLRFPKKLKPVAVRAAGRASFPPSLPQPQSFLLPVALPCHFFPSILR